MSERDIFIAALERPDPAARAAYLDAACPDPAARARVELLLRAHDRPDSLLDSPAVARDTGTPTRTYPATTDAADVSFLEPPARPGSLGRIDHYEMLEVLGRGGFGIVFRAFDDVLQRVVAVKVLAPALAATSPARKRFEREARASAQIRHENVVQVYAVEGNRPLPFLVMEFIPGETLQQRVHRTGPLEVEEAVRLAIQVAEGLAAAHEKGLIHRDVKPANVLIEAGAMARAKLTDFGLARAADDASISQSGVVAGTPMYMSPEQAKGAALDSRTDLFSLGGVLYLMLTGRPPFRADGALAVLRRVVEDAPRPIREIIPEVPEKLCKIVERLHAKDPDCRFQTAREAADALAALLTDPTPPTAAPAPKRRETRRSHGMVVAVATAVTAAVAAVVALLVARPWAERKAEMPPDTVRPQPALPKPAPPKPVTPDEAFARRVAALPADQQVDAVVDELKRRERVRRPDRDFDWKVDSRIEDGRVVMLDLSEVEKVPDVAPVAALVHLSELHLPSHVADIGPLRHLKLRELTSYSTVAFGDLGALKDMPLDYLMLWQWPGTDMTVLRGKPLTFLNLGGGNGRIDLTVLKDMPLKRLYVMETNVADLTPIAHLKLEHLGVGLTKVKSLEPLRDMKLTRFSCNGTAVTDLGPLEGMPLEELYAEDTRVMSFAPVAKAPLKQIALDFRSERDADLLRGITTLEEINRMPADKFWRSVGLPGGAAPPKPVDEEVFARTIAPLLPRAQVKAVETELRRRNPEMTGALIHKAEDGRVVTLGLGRLKNVTDITPVGALRHLTDLKLPPGTTDIGPLRGLPLRRLGCYSETAFTDLSPLKDMPLEYLVVWQWKGTDLTPLKGTPHQTLRFLNVGGGNRKVDLTPLKGMQLTDLYLALMDVDDISVLEGMKLKVLGLNGTRVADLRPLRGMPLELLDVRETRVTDFGPLRDLPLKDVRLDFKPDRRADVLRGMTTLEKINELPVADFWKSVGK